VRLISFQLDGEPRLGVEAGGHALAATELLPKGPRTMAETPPGWIISDATNDGNGRGERIEPAGPTGRIVV
jgi:hypothetical protein